MRVQPKCAYAKDKARGEEAAEEICGYGETSEQEEEEESHRVRGLLPDALVVAARVAVAAGHIPCWALRRWLT